MKKFLSILIVLTMVVVPQSAFAAIKTAPIVASGTFTAGASVLSVTGGALDFTSADGTLLKAASNMLTITFSDSTPLYQAIIISTDNNNKDGVSGITRLYGGDATAQAAGYGSGLIGVTDNTEAAPLHWKVFKQDVDISVPITYTDGSTGTAVIEGYSSYDFNADRFPSGTIVNSEDVGGRLVAPYVSDKSNSEFNTDDGLGYATVLAGVAGGNAEMAVWTPSNVNAASKVALTNAKSITSGTAYLKFLADYTDKSSQAYETQTLKIELVTI